MTRPTTLQARLQAKQPKPQPRLPLPDCDPLTICTFRDQRLVRVERRHLVTSCAGPCVGTVDHLDPEDYWR